jgi:zinc protease
LIGSKNSRLYKHLLHDKQIAQDVTCLQYSALLAGSFLIVCTAKPGIELSQLKDEIFSELDRLMKNGCGDREIQRAKNNYKSSYIYSLQNIDMIADHMNNYNCYLGEPNSFNFDLDRYNSVSTNDIKNTAQKYLQKPYIQLSVIPKRK